MLTLGALLLVMGALLVLVEAHVPTGGVVGVLAIAAVVTGLALLLLAAGTATVVALILSLLVASGAFAVLLIGARRLFRDRRLRPSTGAEALVGHVGVVRRATEPEARVFVDGALWRGAPPRAHEDDPSPHQGGPAGAPPLHGLSLFVGQ